ncbi:MAG: LysR family transcriptional regulator [Flavobacteriales bacterium]|nr:LysR family transcriptional regulator [Flavobacteriales bacterium]MCB9336225.1 LysR family transcriptional regulator [Flavobacteriales bacterium]
MNYTLNQLKIFLKIVENKNITKAAEELHLTQPAVSIQLKNFQNQFDIPLTEVINKRIFITDFGYEIAKAAESILNETQNIDYKAGAYKGLLVGKLKISVVSTAKYVVPFFLSDFIKHNPQIDLVLDVTNKAKVIESLEANEVDFSMVSKMPELPLNSIELLQNKLFLVGAKNEFDKTKNTPKILQNIPLIYREEGSATRRAMEQYLERNEIKANKKLVLTSNEAVKQAVISGLGYSIMPLIGIKNELLNQELAIIPITNLPITTAWNLVWLKEKNLSPVASAFIKYIEANKARIVDEKFKWFERF